MTKKSTLIHFALSLPLALGLVATAGAQSNSGTIRGTVLDPSGALIPSAQVSITDASGVSRKLESSATGTFEVQDLASGNYSVSINAAGFTPALDSVQVSEDKVTEENVTLRISVDQEIEVTADAINK